MPHEESILIKRQLMSELNLKTNAKKEGKKGNRNSVFLKGKVSHNKSVERIKKEIR